MPESIEITAPRSRVRGELLGAAAAALLVAVAFAVPQLASESWRRSLFAAAAPVFGHWSPHIGWGTLPALALAAAVIVRGPALADRLPWRRLLTVGYLTAVAWTLTLALVDGWRRGFTARLADGHEYLAEVPGVTDIPVMLRSFADRIVDGQPDSWTTHVSGHPPGALLFFVLLDRIGLGGPTWAGIVCVLAGCSAPIAVAVALRALGAEEHARTALPFLVLAPAAIWIAVSADAFFAGVTAWAVALLALSARAESARVTGSTPGPAVDRPPVPGSGPVATRQAAVPVAFAAGMLFGFGIYLNYGLILMGVLAVAVLIGARTVRPLLPAALGAMLVVAGFAAAGFWWFDGYHLVVERYYQGIAATRPDGYWWWGNLAATICAVGLATAAALSRALAPSRLRALDPAALLVAAAVCAVAAADLSGLSKAETERIWLPFDMWLLAATAFLPRAHIRPWLTIQAAGALLLVHLLMTNW
ncbi:hypothetical protein [Nocardia jinanensis]|uniref:hypothetical protein n=1 Tax=Nocardia jinanensis TaxID=382504 RepID=UPI0009EBCA81|nr:hypothetical protein [Nocardia jinanensis]